MGLAPEAATAVAENAVTSKKLKIKITCKKPENQACEVPQTPEVNCLKKAQTPLTSCRNYADISGKKLMSTIGTKHVLGTCQLSRKVPKVNNSLDKSTIIHNQITASCHRNLKSVTGCKRRAEEVSDVRETKRLKMDRSTTKLCQQILKKLMDHKRSGPFHIPVDPVALGVPDYFDIIKKRMDLGTVKQRLLQNKYVDAEQFKDDMKLTFANAMLYNPPGNYVHEAAKELDSVFDRLWKPIEIKIVRERRDAKQKGSESSNDKTPYVRCLESISAHRDQFPGKVLPQQKKGSEDLKMQSVEGQHSDPKAIKVSLESVSDCQEDQFPVKVLKQKGFEDLNSRPTAKAVKKIESKPQPNSGDSLSSITQSGDSLSTITQSNCSGPASQSVCSMPAHVKREHPPGKKVAHDDFVAVKVKSTKPLQKGSHDQGSNDKNHGLASFPADSLGATVKGLESVLDTELSPSRALRVAKMKDRFAGLIVKAQHHKLLEPGGEADTAAWQREKEMLQTRQHEEKVKIEAQIRAVQSAARSKTEYERKKQRQAEREAAKIALQKIEQSVSVDNNLEVLKDLEALIGSSLVVMCHDRRSHPNICSQMTGDKLKSPLERLGLYIKEEYRVGDESDYAFLGDEDLEEGEVI